ncbi:MAG: thiamine-phosphate kinase [Candidatus Methanomethylicota archaeon]|uniref:Thiamine-monophosphate kinase n=1 Tax=Thermoproteota archaeon TaxID=2056631 RepID=A0A497ESE3_9CREN|nr:MAG: thiamine-phosphate kinase [Candidatus Verstraetearchaeota archaeon]
MTIEKYGEWRLINIIFEKISKFKNVALPYGDDASAITIPFESRLLVINTDMLVASTDVPPGMNYWQVGRKATVMCISDLAAKGAEPKFLLFSLGLKRNMRLKEFKELIDGLNDGAQEYGAYIIGGDTNEAYDLIISGTAIGFAKRVVSRRGAKEGDLVAVTGFFGETSAGLKILLENFDAPKNIKLQLLKSVYMPKAHVKEGIVLANSNAISSSIDSSDGLAISLYTLAEQNNVGFKIHTLPISKYARKFSELHNLDPFELTFYGGEEYNLIVTIKRGKVKEAMKAIKSVGGKLILIGEVIKEKKVIYIDRGKERIIEKKGWEHFQ